MTVAAQQAPASARGAGQADVSPVSQGIAAIEARAKAGDREAQWQLAGLYLSDEGPVKDLAKGFALMRSAAVLGHVAAQHKLGT